MARRTKSAFSLRRAPAGNTTATSCRRVCTAGRYRLRRGPAGPAPGPHQHPDLVGGAVLRVGVRRERAYLGAVAADGDAVPELAEGEPEVLAVGLVDLYLLRVGHRLGRVVGPLDQPDLPEAVGEPSRLIAVLRRVDRRRSHPARLTVRGTGWLPYSSNVSSVASTAVWSSMST